MGEKESAGKSTADCGRVGNAREKSAPAGLGNGLRILGWAESGNIGLDLCFSIHG